MIQDIYRTIEAVAGCTKEELRGRGRGVDIARYRNMFCAYCYEVMEMSYAEIAFELKRGKNTIQSSIRMHKNELSYDGRYAELYRQLIGTIKPTPHNPHKYN